MENPDKKLIIQKIPLASLIEILENLYNEGVEYIDISGEIKNDKDLIKISVKEDYMILDEEGDSTSQFEEISSEEDEDDVLDKPIKSVQKLTDEDITNLL